MARQGLRDLALLASRVEASVRRLIELSPTLEDEAMMVETASTLGIVADFFNVTHPNFLVTVPSEIENAAVAIRRRMALLLLELEVKKERRAAAVGRLREPFEALSAEVSDLTRLISDFVSPQLDRITIREKPITRHPSIPIAQT